jgi:hypothetical protein
MHSVCCVDPRIFVLLGAPRSQYNSKRCRERHICRNSGARHCTVGILAANDGNGRAVVPLICSFDMLHMQALVASLGLFEVLYEPQLGRAGAVAEGAMVHLGSLIPYLGMFLLV